MDHFEHRDGRLHAEDVEVTNLAARFGTPLYVYSRATLERHWHAFDDALADRIRHLHRRITRDPEHMARVRRRAQALVDA